MLNLFYMKKTRIKILNTYIDNITLEETVDFICNSIKNGEQHHHVVVNAAKMVASNNNTVLRQIINNCDIINADGQSVVWASRILGKPLKERVAGIDLMQELVKKANTEGYKIFLLGAKEKVVSKVANIYSKKYSPETIAGYRNGYFTKHQEQDIAKEISESEANILFVAMPSPKKEIFLSENKHLLKNVNFIMGVGGSFDVISGATKRAPLWMQEYGLEWFYRFLQEPKRMFKRYFVGNTKFIFLVLKEVFK